MTRKNDELERRLKEWKEEYAGGRYEDLGYPSKSSIQTAITYHGPAPQGLNPRGIQLNTKADQVENAVQELERQKDGFKPGRVLRVEYWKWNSAEEERLDALRRIGLPMSRAGYFQALKLAKVYVAGRLGIPFSEAREIGDCV